MWPEVLYDTFYKNFIPNQCQSIGEKNPRSSYITHSSNSHKFVKATHGEQETGFTNLPGCGPWQIRQLDK